MELNIYEYVNNATSTETNNRANIGEEFKFGIPNICLFSTFFVLGLIGNSLVLIGIGLNKGMQTTTNLLILNLALADIFFIIVCIPTTLFSLFGRWPFADFGCKLAQFINHLSAFMSIYLLVFMSVDRYIAVVHALSTFATYRTIKNTTICIIALWLIGICIAIFIGSLFTVVKFGGGESPELMYCLLQYLKPIPENTPKAQNTTRFEMTSLSNTSEIVNHTNEISSSSSTQTVPFKANLYWLGFVLFLYALPLTIIVILYGLMLKFLRGSHGQSVGKSKRRATRMILAVVLTYALCWFLIQLLFILNIILSRNVSHNFGIYIDILNMVANVFAYLNSCTNPILYGFMSKNFRSTFIDVLCCRYSKRHHFGPNDSLRQRRATDSYINNRGSKYRTNDYMKRASVVSRFSQLNQIAATSGSTTYTPSSPLTTELSQKYERQELINDETKLAMDNHTSCHITVGTQTNKSTKSTKSHRRRKREVRSPVISYCSLRRQSTQKTAEVLCT